nr:hypothetical protein [Tanacetum cinerariifolium]
MCEMVCQIVQKKQEEKQIEEEQAANARYWKIPACCDDDDDYNSAIIPVLSTEEPDNSLSMRDEHLETIPATESDKVIKSSVKYLVSILSEFEGIPDTMCDVHLVNNPTLFEVKDHCKIAINSNDDISSSDDDSLYNENIKYVEASPHNSELVSLEVAEIVISEEEEIEDDNLHKKLLNINLLIAKIEALKDNPTPSFVFLTKSYSTSPKSFLEETNTFHNSLHEFESFYFYLEEISSGSTTTHSDTSLLDYKAFYFDEDHIKEISRGSTTTHSDISLSEYDSFIFYLSNDQFPPTDRSNFTHEEFVDELAHIISPSEYDCFYFRNFPDPVEDDHFPHLAYVVWIFLAYLTYPVIPLYLHSFGNEDTIFDPGIAINRFYSFKPGLLLAWDRVFEIKDAFGNKQYKPEDIQELFRKLLNDLQNIQEELAEYINTRGWNRPAFYNNGDDDDVDYTIAITPVLSTEEPDNSLSMGDEHLDTIPATKSDKVIKSSVEDLVPIPSKSEGISDTMCDVHLVNNHTPLEAKDHFEIVINSNDDYSSSDDDFLYNENIEYVEASPHDFELVSLEFPPTDRSDSTHEEFADELAHIISPPDLNSEICENLSSTTRVNLPVEDDHSPLLAYVVKENKEKNKTGPNQEKNGKRGKARQCRRPVTVEKAEKKKKIQVQGTKNANPKSVFNLRQRKRLELHFTQRSTTRAESAN